MMKRTAGIVLALVGLVVAAPMALAAPLELGLDLVDARPAADGIGLDGGVSASSDATVDGQTPTGSPLVQPPRAPEVRPQGANGLARIAPSSAAAATTGTLVGLGLIGALWAFFSRIDSNRILDNGVRSKVHEAIEHNPGITIKEITQLLGIGWGTAIYHLKRLEEERLVVSERHRQFRRFFKNGGGIVNETKVAFSELKNPTTARLAKELLERPGSAQKELCELLGISAPLAHKYLSRMEDAQLLTRQREWKVVKYFPTDKLAGLVQSAPVAVIA